MQTLDDMSEEREYTKLTISKIYGKIFHWCLFKYIYKNIKNIHTSYIQCMTNMLPTNIQFKLYKSKQYRFHFSSIHIVCIHRGYANNLFLFLFFFAV